MNAKKAKALRRRARAATAGLPEQSYLVQSNGRVTCGQSTRGAYQALKTGKFNHVAFSE